MPCNYILPQSCQIIDNDFRDADHLLILSKDLILDAIYLIEVDISDWKWTNLGTFLEPADSGFESVAKGVILQSFDMSWKPESFKVNRKTLSVTFVGSRDISVYSLC
jgi:hypothetical protein